MASATTRPCLGCGCGAIRHFGPPTEKGPCRDCADCRRFDGVGYRRLPLSRGPVK